MKQWFFSVRPQFKGDVGANPTDSPSLENKKAVNETPVEKHPSFWLTRYPSRGRDFINGSNVHLVSTPSWTNYKADCLGFVNTLRKKVVGGSHKAVCLNSKTLKGYCCSGANPSTPPTRMETARLGDKSQH